MNLKALFNLNFFKENIRKSKGLLAFVLGVIPVINIIYLIVLVTNSSTNLINFNTLSLLTYTGIIFIPISLAVTLFGFIFKKKSVDFVMSKPICRKSIFITNTLGGIFILLIFMIINTAIFGIFGLVFDSLTIPLALLFDYFIFWFISYVFMFLVANLAVLLTGNIITSFVVLAILVFIVPYMNGIAYLNNDYYSQNNYIVCDNQECKPDYYYCYDNQDCLMHLNNNEYKLSYSKTFSYNFIAPLSLFNNGKTFYNTVSLIKMGLLSLAYVILGYKIFKKRKMENNEISFKSSIVHYFVKGITFIPVCFITYVILKETDFIGWLISLAGIIIYSIVYDLITRKEIYKPFKSLFISLALFLMFTGCYFLIFDVTEQKNKILENVDSIIYENIEIKNADEKNKIIKALLDNKPTEINYNYDFVFKKGTTTYEVNVDINENLVAYLNELIKEYNNKKIINLDINKIHYLEYNGINIPITKKIKKLIMDNLDKIDEFKIDSLEDEDLLYLYSYQNHDYQKIFIPLKLSDDLYKEVVAYQNNLFVNCLAENQNNLYFNLYAFNTTYFDDEDYYVFNYVIKSNLNTFLQYLKTDNKININQETSKIHVIANSREYIFTISNTAKFKNEFDQYKEKLEDNFEYQNLIKEYQEMVDVGVYY